MKKQTLWVVGGFALLWMLSRSKSTEAATGNGSSVNVPIGISHPFCADPANHGKPVPGMKGFVCGKNNTAIQKVNKGKTGG